ncbi:MAG: hypothetical protein ACTSSB_01505 [Candidatus Heimdallarchaeota archaeon]
MFRRKSMLIGIFAVVLSLSSLFFLPISIGVNGIENPILDPIDTGEEIVTEQGKDEPIDSGTTFDAQDVTTNTTGIYKTQAYFTQDSFVNLEGLEYNFEWEKFEDVKDDAANFVAVDFIRRNDTTQPNFKLLEDTWQEMWSSQQIVTANNKRVWSIIYSPEFTVDTYIKDSVIFMVGGEIYYSRQSVFDVRVRLERFNPVTLATAPLVTASGDFTDSDDNLYNSTSGNYYGEVYEGTLANKTLIPAGYRLKATIECKLDSTSVLSYHTLTRCQVRSGQVPSMYSTEWNVDSTNDTFDNYYVLENSLESIGMQLYYYQDSYPTIELTGLVNNTAYNEPINGTITVSSDSWYNEYSWDLESGNVFTSPQIVSLPETNGWHTLDVIAMDEFNNTAEANYRFYYDTSVNNVWLNSPLNNSLITDGQLLNFSLASDVISSLYEWDKEGVEVIFNDPYDITPNRNFEGWHNLTINTTDLIGSYETVYFFEFDNSDPLITLSNVFNMTTHAQGKNIEFEITDRTDTIDVDYYWDSDSWASLSPIEGNLYRTYLPVTEGWHYLTVRANDTFGQLSQQFYAFNTSLNVLLVELYSMVNNSYYYGGNDVEVTIANDNDTVRFYWGSDSPSDGSVVGDLLTLTGADALSTTAGTYTLIIIVFDILDVEYHFMFRFIVDRMKPTVIPGSSYNESRQLTSAIFSFTISDNWTATIDLDIDISIDNGFNVTFEAPYQYSLQYLDEGVHRLIIYVVDIAGNTFVYNISFTIDETAPSLSVNFPEMAQTPDSSRYVPANALVNVTIGDDDPIIKSYYSWDYGSYVEFSGTFYLPGTEIYSRLLVMTNDSLGNTGTRTYYLTIDDTAPTISLNQILNNSKINAVTPLSFTVEDINDDTIDLITSQWDLEAGPVIRSPLFIAELLFDHSTETEATLNLFMEDIVGNNYTCIYYFELDFEAPIYTLTNVLNESYVHGNDLLNFTDISTDLLNFYYRWDDDVDYTTLALPYDLNVPLEDGNHTLYIRLEDDTGGGIYVNYVEAMYVFIVDDIEVTYIEPMDFHDEYYYTMYYDEYFNFSINIEDAINNTQINNLFATIDSSADSYNLGVDVYNISKMYYCSVIATNVTETLFTEITFNFQQFSGNSQTVTVFIRVDKQEGNMVLVDIDNVVTYEDNITIQFKLNDYANVTAQTITHLAVNDSEDHVAYHLVDIPNLIYEITFNTTLFTIGKGSFVFKIYTESTFYFGLWNDTSSVAITIEPIPITLTVDVSGVEIIYDNELVVTATLLRADGSPISAQQIDFLFYIAYKEGYVVTTTGLGPNSFTEYDEIIPDTAFTNLEGICSVSLKITENMVEISLEIVYHGNNYYDPITTPFTESIFAIEPPSGLELKWIITIIL